MRPKGKTNKKPEKTPGGRGGRREGSGRKRELPEELKNKVKVYIGAPNVCKWNAIKRAYCDDGDIFFTKKLLEFAEKNLELLASYFTGDEPREERCVTPEEHCHEDDPNGPPQYFICLRVTFDLHRWFCKLHTHSQLEPSAFIVHLLLLYTRWHEIEAEVRPELVTKLLEEIQASGGQLHEKPAAGTAKNVPDPTEKVTENQQVNVNNDASEIIDQARAMNSNPVNLGVNQPIQTYVHPNINESHSQITVPQSERQKPNHLPNVNSQFQDERQIYTHSRGSEGHYFLDKGQIQNVHQEGEGHIQGHSYPVKGQVQNVQGHSYPAKSQVQNVGHGEGHIQGHWYQHKGQDLSYDLEREDHVRGQISHDVGNDQIQAQSQESAAHIQGKRFKERGQVQGQSTPLNKPVTEQVELYQSDQRSQEDVPQDLSNYHITHGHAVRTTGGHETLASSNLQNRVSYSFINQEEIDQPGLYQNQESGRNDTLVTGDEQNQKPHQTAPITVLDRLQDQSGNHSQAVIFHSDPQQTLNSIAPTGPAHHFLPNQLGPVSIIPTNSQLIPGHIVLDISQDMVSGTRLVNVFNVCGQPIQAAMPSFHQLYEPSRNLQRVETPAPQIHQRQILERTEKYEISGPVIQVPVKETVQRDRPNILQVNEHNKTSCAPNLQVKEAVKTTDPGIHHIETSGQGIHQVKETVKTTDPGIHHIETSGPGIHQVKKTVKTTDPGIHHIETSGLGIHQVKKTVKTTDPGIHHIETSGPGIHQEKETVKTTDPGIHHIETSGPGIHQEKETVKTTDAIHQVNISCSGIHHQVQETVRISDSDIHRVKRLGPGIRSESAQTGRPVLHQVPKGSSDKIADSVQNAWPLVHQLPSSSRDSHYVHTPQSHLQQANEHNQIKQHTAIQFSGPGIHQVKNTGSIGNAEPSHTTQTFGSMTPRYPSSSKVSQSIQTFRPRVHSVQETSSSISHQVPYLRGTGIHEVHQPSSDRKCKDAPKILSENCQMRAPTSCKNSIVTDLRAIHVSSQHEHPTIVRQYSNGNEPTANDLSARRVSVHQRGPIFVSQTADQRVNSDQQLARNEQHNLCLDPHQRLDVGNQTTDNDAAMSSCSPQHTSASAARLHLGSQRHPELCNQISGNDAVMTTCAPPHTAASVLAIRPGLGSQQHRELGNKSNSTAMSPPHLQNKRVPSPKHPAPVVIDYASKTPHQQKRHVEIFERWENQSEVLVPSTRPLTQHEESNPRTVSLSVLQIGPGHDKPSHKRDSIGQQHLLESVAPYPLPNQERYGIEKDHIFREEGAGTHEKVPVSQLPPTPVFYNRRNPYLEHNQRPGDIGNFITATSRDDAECAAPGGYGRQSLSQPSLFQRNQTSNQHVEYKNTQQDRNVKSGFVPSSSNYPKVVNDGFPTFENSAQMKNSSFESRTIVNTGLEILASSALGRHNQHELEKIELTEKERTFSIARPSLPMFHTENATESVCNRTIETNILKDQGFGVSGYSPYQVVTEIRRRELQRDIRLGDNSNQIVRNEITPTEPLTSVVATRSSVITHSQPLPAPRPHIPSSLLPVPGITRVRHQSGELIGKKRQQSQMTMKGKKNAPKMLSHIAEEIPNNDCSRIYDAGAKQKKGLGESVSRSKQEIPATQTTACSISNKLEPAASSECSNESTLFQPPATCVKLKELLLRRTKTTLRRSSVQGGASNIVIGQVSGENDAKVINRENESVHDLISQTDPEMSDSADDKASKPTKRKISKPARISKRKCSDRSSRSSMSRASRKSNVETAQISSRRRRHKSNTGFTGELFPELPRIQPARASRRKVDKKGQSRCLFPDFTPQKQKETKSKDSVVMKDNVVNEQDYTVREKLNEKGKKTRSYECKICHVLRQSVGSIKRHFITHRKVYKCTCCSKNFSTKNGLYFHKMKKSGNKFDCTLCKFSTYYVPFLRAHVKRSHPENNAKVFCDICGKSLKNKTSLKSHLQGHKLQELKEVCNECGKIFSNVKYLNRHEKRVHSTKDHHCTYSDCDKSFPSKCQLKAHIDRVHLRVRKFSCTYPNCGQAFFKMAEMQQHICVHHTKERTYPCNEKNCGKAFRSRHNLVVHMRLHTDEKPFRCKRCDYSCRQKNALNFHMKRHHSDKETVHDQRDTSVISKKTRGSKQTFSDGSKSADGHFVCYPSATNDVQEQIVICSDPNESYSVISPVGVQTTRSRYPPHHEGIVSVDQVLSSADHVITSADHVITSAALSTSTSVTLHTLTPLLSPDLASTLSTIPLAGLHQDGQTLNAQMDVVNFGSHVVEYQGHL